MHSFPCCALPYTASSKPTTPATAHQIQLLEEEGDEEIDERKFTGGSTDTADIHDDNDDDNIYEIVNIT